MKAAVSSSQDGSTIQDSKIAQIAEILALLAKVSERFEPGDSEMKQWMAQNFANPLMADLLQSLTITMFRVLDTIAQLEPVNGITVSEKSGIPKGTVSKVTRRMVSEKLISAESLPNNKKEIRFRLTPLGRELSEAHRAFDQQMERGFVQFLGRYTPTELGFLARVLQDVSEASFLKPPM